MRAPELRPLRIGEILDVSIKLYLRNALTFMAIVAIALLPVMAVGTLLLVGIAPDPGGFVSQADMNAFVGASIAVTIIQFMGGWLATAACLKGVAEAYVGRPVRAGESVSFAFKRFHSVLWILILLFLIFVLLGFASALVAVIFSALGVLGIVIAVLAILGAALFVAVTFFASHAALLAEGYRGTKALSRSQRLVQGRWWPTAAVLIVAYLLTFVVGIIFDVLFNELITIDPGERLTSFTGVLVWNQLVAFIVSVLTQPLLAAVVAIAYFDLRVRKEGFDLELLARQIGGAPEAQAGGTPARARDGSAGFRPPPPPPPPPPHRE
ncbi:MAG: hypothetical protein ACRDJV_13225 [Actinomycetota bacterium]